MAKFAVFAAVLAVLGSVSASPVHPDLQALLTNQPFAVPNLIITLHGKTSAVRTNLANQVFSTREAKIDSLTNGLKAHTTSAQANILSYLNSIQSLTVRSYWISNQIFVSGANAAVVAGLAAFPEISEIRQEKILSILDPIPANLKIEDHKEGPFAEWGINDISAPQAWDLGYTGEGIRIATIDTGVRGTHQTLSGNYVGAGGWFDPYQGTATPNDQNGHGTHVTANIAGGNGVGVAPGAQWLACKGCSTSSCTEDALLRCGQWVLCPSGSAPCANVPHVCSNSWGGGQGDTFYNEVTDNWAFVDITAVFANGNSGPLCTTANSPADQDVIGVGSTNSQRVLSIFSSKGPTVAGGIKPDVSAPGTDVRSAWYTSDTAYSVISGTSMACPHVAGVVALAKSANKGSEDFNLAQVRDILYKTVDTNLQPTTRNCGDIDTRTFPNNSFGWGKVNALKAVQRVLDTTSK